MRRIDLSVEVSGSPEDLGESLESILALCREVEGVADVACEVRIVDNDTIRRINSEYRHIDSVTDVLSFPSVYYPAGKTAKDCPGLLRREFDPELGAAMIGDVVICLDRAREQAREYGHGLKREICYLMAHSVFHLFGYDHMRPEDKRVMREREERVMLLANLPRKEEND